VFETDVSPRRILPMDGLRGFAVLLVFCVHYCALIEPWMPVGTASFRLVTALRTLGNSGVDLFFVLSGFLIYGTLMEKPRPFIPYFRRRLERIYPAFLCLFVVYFGLSFVLPSENHIPTELWNGIGYVLANLSLLPLLVTPYRPMIIVTWSLSYELFFYIVMPIAIGALMLRRWSRAYRAVLWLSVAGLIFSCAGGLGGGVRVAMFVGGILLRDTLRTTPTHVADAIGMTGLLGAIVLTTAISELGLSQVWRFLMLFISFYALCYGSFAARGLCARMFSYSPLRWLGNMSYSFYLSHGLALKAFFLIVGLIIKPKGNCGHLFWGLFPFAIATALVGATVLFIFVEKPYSFARRSLRVPAPQWSEPPETCPSRVATAGAVGERS